MKAPQNIIFIKVDSEVNDEVITESGNKFFVSTTPFFEGEGQKIKQHAFKRHYGIVYGDPGELSDTTKVRPVPTGRPEPGRYNSSDDIQLLKSRNVMVDSWSSINLFTHQWKTCADFIPEVQSGDKIYFHFNTLSEESIVSYLEEKVYKLPYSQSICVVRNDEIIPVAGNVLVEPKWEDGVQDLGDGKRGKLTASGLVTELHDKPKYLEGIVKYICSPMQDEEVGVFPGDTIIYAPHADWEVEIEGKPYYVIKYWDIEAKVETKEELLEIPSPSGFIPNI